MTSAEQIIHEALANDVVLYLKDGRLAYTVSGKTLPEGLKDKIAMHKEGVIEYLSRIGRPVIAQGSDVPNVLPRQPGTVPPLSFAQRRLWFLGQLDETSTAYHIPIDLRLRGTLRPGALRGALDALFARHEALRTVFVAVDGEPHVELLPADQPFLLTEYDLRGSVAADEELARITHEEALAPFDLARGPLIRGRLLRLTEDDHVLVITQHHIVSDGWSVGILVNELSALYGAFVLEQPNPLAPLAIQFPDYAAWQQQWLTEERLAEQLNYWDRSLAEAPILLALPTDRPRHVSHSRTREDIPVLLGPELTRTLRQLSNEHDTTVFMVLMAAWAAVLARLSGQNDLVIGTPSANRSRREIESLVGFFVNTLALRIDLSGEPTVGDLLRRVRTVALAAQDHQDAPFEQVVERVNPPRSLDHTPIFQVMFAWQNNDLGTFDLPGLKVELGPESGPSSLDTIKFDLELLLSESGDTIGGSLSYATDLFDRATIERQVGYLRTVLEAMVDHADMPVAHIDLLAAEERSLLLASWNRTETAYPADSCIHRLFEEQVLRTPDAIALALEDRSLTYSELNAKANRLAHDLIERGIGPDTPVAICVERSFGMLIGLLAILKAGGAYVPIEPAYPAARLRRILADANPAVVIADAGGRAAIDACAWQGGVILDPDQSRSMPAHVDANPVVHGLTSRHLAYIIYTSGSTGLPKGVMVEHRSVVNLWQALRLAVFGAPHSAIRVGLNASFAFDASVKQWVQLLSGCCLVLIPQRVRTSGTDLLAYLKSMAVDAFDTTPSQMDLLIDAGLLEDPQYQPHTVLLGGEPIGHTAWETLAAHPSIFFHNVYGPTECTVDSTAALIRSWQSHVSIGRPIANARIYLLDAYGQPVPLGAVGELYIGGVGVARGYLHRPELTAERFLADPFVADTQARMYRTGDLARYLPDGNIVFLGRNDHQVKLRGFRIELGEIEARLTEHPAVREAVVLALGEADHQRLVAYVVPDTSSATTADDLVATLRTHLAAQLPDYMVPSAFVTLQALPLTPNGKLDRRALPAPGEDAFARHAYQAPEGEIEIALAALWQELLKVERVGRHDHFFELGGHSLLAVRLRSRLASTFHVELPLTELFAHPTVSELAMVISQASSVANLPPITSVSREGTLPLSFAQQRLWFLAQFDGVSTTYHMPTTLRLRGRPDTHALHQALNAVFSRHEVLRTTVVSVEGQPQVELIPSQEPFLLTEHDIRENTDRETELARLTREEAFEPFDLSRGPLIRGRLVHLAEDDHVLLITQHHIVSDGWSVGILIREFSALYSAFVHGQADPLAPLAVQYPDYAAWQRQWLTEERLGEQLDYWHRALADAPVLLALPTDRPRADARSYAGATHAITLDAPLTHALRLLSQQHGTTVFMTVLAAWAAVLARLSGQDNVVIGTPSANRGRHEIEPLVGFFVNTLALHVDLSGEPSVADLLARVRTVALAAQDHQDVPFEQVVERINPPRRLEHTPIFQVMFAWQNNDRGSFDLPGLQVEAVPTAFDRIKFDLELDLGEAGDTIQGSLGYATDLFDHTTIERHVGYLHALLRAMVEHADEPVARIDLLSAEERVRALVHFNPPRTSYPEETCVHELIEMQTARSPDAIAMIYGEDRWTYRDFNGRANTLARRIQSLGTEPGDIVPVVMTGGMEVPLSFLAIMKAGAAFAPLDMNWPVERLHSVLSALSPKVVLVNGNEKLDSIDPSWLQVVVAIDDIDASENLQGRHHPEMPIYVVHTSGSTGIPKGAVNIHRGIVNRLCFMSDYFDDLSDEIVLQTTNHCFDSAVWQYFWPLIKGGASVIPAFVDNTYDPDEIASLLTRHNVTTTDFTPALLDTLCDFVEQSSGSAGIPFALRRIIVGGDKLTRPTLTRFLSLFPGTKIHNFYGPSEASIGTICQELSEATSNPVPIGKPISNTVGVIVDTHFKPVPIGCVGELLLGGDCVGAGYLHNPEETRLKFVANEFPELSCSTLYRTGDLARHRHDGVIEYLGRIDHQIKIRGFRIEPGEIEMRLLENRHVREAVVSTHGDDESKQLVAYIVTGAAEGDTADTRYELGSLTTDLRSHLARHLPRHMIPSALVVLDALPLTSNGKLDRKSLPAPDQGAFVGRGYIPPQGETETIMSGIWQELLKIDRVGRHDNFFELGGHSLLAIRLVNRVRSAFGVKLEMSSLFKHPELSAYAKRVLITSLSERFTSVDPREPVTEEEG